MIITFKPYEYAGNKVYMRRVGNKIWEYFVIMRNELYTAHFISPPSWYRRFLKEPFTKKQTNVCLYMLKKMAETTIETVSANREDIGKKVADKIIAGKCIACGDTGIINKNTSVEEKCPICQKVNNNEPFND